MSAATDRFTASLAALSTAVDNLPHVDAATTDATFSAAADQVDSLTAKVTALATPAQ